MSHGLVSSKGGVQNSDAACALELPALGAAEEQDVVKVVPSLKAFDGPRRDRLVYSRPQRDTSRSFHRGSYATLLVLGQPATRLF